MRNRRSPHFRGRDRETLTRSKYPNGVDDARLHAGMEWLVYWLQTRHLRVAKPLGR
jgi:hypothetical protein